jgi:group II intron reverse transcriptase/maturase
MQEEICFRTREAPKAPKCRGSAGTWYTAIEARKGKPGYRAMPEPKHRHVTTPRQAENYCEREKPPHAFGESYQAYYSERGKATYKGKVLTEVRSLQRKLEPDTVGSENYKQTSLQGIANKARINKRYRFQDLYRCLNVEFLLSCWPLLNKKAASGVDRVTWQMYAENLQANVEALVEKLKSKHYRARLVRRRYIPKADGKKRPLGIPVIEDKLLQTACARLLSAIYEQDFFPFSHGYRPGRGAKDAVRELGFDLQYGRYGYVVDADVRGFFTNMDHEWLLEMISQRIDDKAFLNLIRKWLKAGILETDGSVIHPDTGTPQGGNISPVLANVYLHYVLDLWFEKVIKRHCKGDVLIARYADDWICAFQYREEAEGFFHELLPKRLAKFRLELSEEKTNMLRFSRFHPSMRRRFTFLGFEFFWTLDRQKEPRVKRRTARDRLQAACREIKQWIRKGRHLPGKVFFKTLNAKLRGHYNYYGVHGNSKSLHRFYDWAMECVLKWLNRRGGKRKSYTRERFFKMLDLVGIAKPRITEARKRRVYAS